MKTNRWLKEIFSWAFKLHPIVLLFLGLLDLEETFLVLVVSYLLMGIASLARSTYVIGVDCFKLKLPESHNLSGKTGVIISSFFGWMFMLAFSSFLLLLLFGLLYDAVERREYPGSVFDGKEGAMLVRSLLINAVYFSIIELIQLILFVRNYTLEQHNVLTAYAFGADLRNVDKWQGLQIGWLMLWYAFFLFMLTALSFKVAIVSFFVFDCGWLILAQKREALNR